MPGTYSHARWSYRKRFRSLLLCPLSIERYYFPWFVDPNYGFNLPSRLHSEQRSNGTPLISEINRRLCHQDRIQAGMLQDRICNLGKQGNGPQKKWTKYFSQTFLFSQISTHSFHRKMFAFSFLSGFLFVCCCFCGFFFFFWGGGCCCCCFCFFNFLGGKNYTRYLHEYILLFFICYNA